MNNILTFEDYKKMSIRQVESVIYHQFIDEDIKDEVNEGIIRKAINKAAGKFIQSALADEIEKGKELEKSIKEALDGLNKGFEEIEKRINSNSESDANSKSKLTSIEKVKEAIKAVQSQAFDTLTMIGSEGEIDFGGFLGSATVVAAANFGILFSPIRSLFITRKAYKYFLGIIKQTIRRNLLVIQLNFDQFENLILQKSFETEEDSERMTKATTLHDIINAMQNELCGKDSKMFSKKKSKEMKEYLDSFKKAQDIAIRQHKEDARNNPLRSLWEDQHNNTYTRTLEQIKQYINDDSQKELDAMKNSITKMSGNDVDLVPFGELMISAAEEYAVHTNHGINNNFIKMSSVFNLDNQKKLIMLMKEAQEENEREVEKNRNEQKVNELKEKLEKDIETGKSLYEEKLKDSTEKPSFDKFNEEFSENDIKCLKAFFFNPDEETTEGKDAYEELIEKDPLYKYLIDNDNTLNTFLSSLNDLKVVEISDIDDFYENIAKKNQTLYYIMANRSIKDAINSKTPEKYFGFEGIEGNVNADNILNSDITEDDDKINSILSSIFPTKKFRSSSGKKTTIVGKKRYFLSFNGSGNSLFNILHNDFKTEIFNDDKTYVSDVSIESKETIMKLIHKYLNIGKSITTQFAEYLVRLEAHMLLKNQKPWFVVADNNILKDCFLPESDKIINKNAFVEIQEEDYEDIKSFLSKYHSLSDKDFDVNVKTTTEKKEPEK